MKKFLRQTRWIAAWVGALATLPWVHSKAETVVFTIDSASSSLTVAGAATVAGFGTFPYGEQAAGSLVTSYSGSITVDLDNVVTPGSITFSSADIVAAINGQWQPNDSGSSLTPPGDANYGVSAAIGAGKIRNLSFELGSSGAATVTGGQFAASTQNWSHKTGDFDVFSPVVGAGATAPLTAIAGNVVGSTAGDGSLSLSGKILTLTLPVNISIPYFLPGTPDLSGSYDYTGTIVAKAKVNVPETVVFTIDPNSSSLTVSGEAVVGGFGTFPFGEQAAGSLVTSYSGSITATVDNVLAPGSITFDGADIVAAISGQWQPNNSGNGLTPASDANYGVRAALGDGKIRNLSFELVTAGAATVTGGQFPSSNQDWSHKTGDFDVFSPVVGDGSTGPLTDFAGGVVSSTAGDGSLSLSGKTLTLTLPVNISIPYNVPGSPTLTGFFGYTGTIVATATVTVPDVPGSFVFHAGWTGGGSNVDTVKSLHKQGAAPQQLTVNNLINSAHGINGVGLQVQDFPNAAGLTADDFIFEMSAQGAFGANPNWQSAPTPTISVNVLSGELAVVSLQWPNNAIEDRWLRVTVQANFDTCLAEPQVFYLGHLRGETGATESTYTVAFADITPIRSQVGASVDAGSIADIDKNGIVAFADISAMRSNVGKQLSNITVP
jgi:hypothetical protein